MTKYKLLLLDLDGTLVDSFTDIATSLAAAYQAIGLGDGLDLMPLVRRGAPLEELYEHALGRPPHPVEDAEILGTFQKAYREHYLPRCLDSTVPYPGVVETLTSLRARSERPVIAIATAKRSDTARRVLAGTGLLDLVDVVAGSEGIPSKPDPAVLHRAAGLAGVPVTSALMVGDTGRDVVAARAAGCAAAAVTYGGLGEAELRPHAPDYLLPEFASLIGVLAA